MLSLRKINPMARAVGTMGIVASMVGVVTFAQLTSNVVAVTPNLLSTASAKLAVEATGTCSAGSVDTSIPGFPATTKLVPGVASAPVSFCLANNGDVPLAVTANIPQTLSGALTDAVSLTVSCAGGTAQTFSLSAWSAGSAVVAPSLAVADNTECTETATLSSSYAGPGGEAVPAFSVNFVGTDATPATT